MVLEQEGRESEVERNDNDREISQVDQGVLDCLKTIQIGNVSFIHNLTKFGKREIVRSIIYLKAEELIDLSHHGEDPFTMKSTPFYKLTEQGDLLANEMPEPKLDLLVMLPFVVEHSDTYTRYTSNFRSNKDGKVYLTELKTEWNQTIKMFEYKGFCTCKSHEINQSCKHVERLKQEVDRWDSKI